MLISHGMSVSRTINLRNPRPKENYIMINCIKKIMIKKNGFSIKNISYNAHDSYAK